MLYAVGPGRAPSSEVAHWSMLGYRPDEFPGRAVFEALGRGQEVSAEHVFAYAALRPAERREDGLWLTGRPRYGEDEEDAATLVDALRRARGRRAHVLARARLARRGDPARRRQARRAGHRHRTRSSATAIPCSGRSRSFPRRSAPRAPQTSGRAGRWRSSRARGQRAPRRARPAGVERDHAQVVGTPEALSRRSRSGTACTARSSPSRRSCAASPPPSASTRSRRRRRRDAAADLRGRLDARERAARRRRHLRLRPPEGDRRGRPHEGPARQAADDRGARRGAASTSRPTARSSA